ncbi:MAG: helix-turn-helix domain-containing protein, partial [Planctomycetaceae bacterium]
MAKKYLSLEEAASLLGMSVDAVRRAREKGDLRGFQDRGSWKFREQDIDEFRRSQQADSSPDMPMLSADGGLNLSSSDSDVRLMADPADDDLGDLVNSGSDVRLSGDSGPKLDKQTAVPDSDSDVKLFSADILSSDSDSDVKLSAAQGRTDSDIRLAPPDSDLKLIPRSSSTKAGDDSGISLEVAGSGARLNSDDLLAEIDSGISLSADDSGISLESFDSQTRADDSGISLDAGDSGISLDLDLDAP